MKKLISFLLIAGFLLPNLVKADEGMWLPMFIKRLNYKDMKEKGLQLTPEEIYSVNNSSLKDAIVRLGGGFCTGEIISNKGLMLTNHHCGYSVIQEKSSVENDYLTDGFWAQSFEEELPAGFSVSFLQRMDDVSEVINGQLNEEMSEDERAQVIRQLADSIESSIEGDEKYIEATVKSFFKGNEFYVFTYKTFPDVRLVGAPPSSIGKFGGDTDNWMWPRHTGDFTLFRVYAGENNEPAEFSEDNKPYKPKHFLPISLEEREEEDFTMIFGYPGSTDRFLTSWGIELATEKDQPSRVKIRRKKLDIYEKYQEKSDAVRIMYASKHARVSNYWKYFIGQTAGLKRLKVYEKKKKIEDDFEQWISKNDKRKEKYGEVLTLYEEAYGGLSESQLAQTYLFEAIFGIEAVRYGFQFVQLKGMMEQIEQLESKKDKTEEEEKQLEGLTTRFASTVEALKAGAEAFYKDYHLPIDKEVFAEMINFYESDIEDKFQPEAYNELVAKFKGDYEKMADKYFKKSLIGDKEETMAFLDDPKLKTLQKDPIVNLSDIFLNFYRAELNTIMKPSLDKKKKADRLFVDALRKMYKDKTFADDANSTMRMTYGQVLDYFPKDAVHYDFITTAEGILEKEDPTNPEFIVPGKLKELIQNKNYGRYANENGDLIVCFLSNNDITGGNSGSPVINGKGHLIGTAFDGNWEAMSGDIAFEPNLQRTISVDVRYTLFIIDKFAGAKRLIKEMKIIDPSAQKAKEVPVEMQKPASPEE